MNLKSYLKHLKSQKKQYKKLIYILAMIYMLIYCIFFIGIAAIIYSLLFPDFEYYIQNGSSFIYSLAWEDPRLDFKYLDVENDNVLMITTGGCNVLNTLL